jgi:hypothetical protein
VGVIRVEPEGVVKESTCERCGGVNRLLHGYVFHDEDAHGIYFLEWCDGDHPARVAFLTLGLGAFDESTGPAGRAAFCVLWRAEGMSFTDEPARDRPALLGEFVPRDTALAVPGVDHVWHVADHIVLDDPRAGEVRRWIEGG